MSHSKYDNNRVSLVTDSFLGLESPSEKSERHSASRLDNFRVAHDGTLKKRFGYKKLFSLSGTPICLDVRRASKSAYYVSGDKVFSVDLESGENSLAASLESAPEEAALLHYRDSTLLFDGESVKRFDGNGFSAADGYIPMIGYAWDQLDGGTMHEDFNLLSRHYRINYRISSSNAKYVLPAVTESIEAITVNGEQIPAEYYFLGIGGEAFYIQNQIDESATTLTVYATLPAEHLTETPLSRCRKAVSCGGTREIIFAYGAQDTPQYAFRSMYVEDPLKDPFVRSIYGEDKDRHLYFPKNGQISVGGGLTVTSVLPFSDTALIFSESEAYLSDTQSALPMQKLINQSIGCVSSGASVICAEKPFTVCRGGIYRWNELDSQFNELTADCIFDKLSKYAPELTSDDVSLIANIPDRELWFFSPSSQKTLVFNLENEQWYTFSGFLPELAFVLDGDVYFTSKDSVFVFDRSLSCDLPDGVTQTPIASEYTGPWLDADTPGFKKRLGHFSVACESQYDSELTVSFELDSKKTPEYTLLAEKTDAAPQIITQRLPKYRFDLARIRIVSSSLGAQTILKTVLAVRPSERVYLK